MATDFCTAHQKKYAKRRGKKATCPLHTWPRPLQSPIKSYPPATHQKFLNLLHTFSFVRKLWHNLLYFLSFLDIFSIVCTLSQLFTFFIISACNTLSIFELISLKKNIKLTCCCHKTGLKPDLFLYIMWQFLTKIRFSQLIVKLQGRWMPCQKIVFRQLKTLFS